ncbi:MAG TPA: 30S ribosomal protein S11 [Kiritimatiellia bacterium]|nr:30S ribosomal protein S11 [Kiritimatiellia bacterium]HRZ13686.1 30S ribosomal protein S11 [Kiritimatiellia bacterium]HSA19218.1 30S ribosomal protein S11 [Kiritimatiellia bacterium]
MADEKEKQEVKAPPAEAAVAEAAAPGAVPAEGAAPAAEGEAAKPVKRKAVKGARTVPVGVVYVRATFNNTMVTITDMRGAVVCWSTAGRCGFKGSRRSTAYAATVVAQEAARQAIGFGMHEVEVRIQGPGAGRESAIRAIQSAGLTITVIKDITPVPHNGCRPPKRRRV